MLEYPLGFHETLIYAPELKFWQYSACWSAPERPDIRYTHYLLWCAPDEHPPDYMLVVTRDYAWAAYYWQCVQEQRRALSA
jgi:hypothetical protein